MGETKTPRPTKPNNLLSTFLSPLESWKIQLIPRHVGIVGRAPERVTARVDNEREVVHVPEGGGVYFEQYPEGSTVLPLIQVGFP